MLYYILHKPGPSQWMWPSCGPSFAEQGGGRTGRQAPQLALAGKGCSTERNTFLTTEGVHRTLCLKKWDSWTFFLLSESLDHWRSQAHRWNGFVGSWNTFWCEKCALPRYRSSQTAVGAGGTSVEALSSPLTGSSPLHTASSTPLGEGCQYD